MLEFRRCAGAHAQTIVAGWLLPPEETMYCDSLARDSSFDSIFFRSCSIVQRGRILIPADVADEICNS
jgi:hypothetical protein